MMERKVFFAKKKSICIYTIMEDIMIKRNIHENHVIAFVLMWQSEIKIKKSRAYYILSFFF